MKLTDIHYSHILNGITHTFNTASISVMLGRNGAGKSTLLNLLAGIIKPRLGEMEIDDIKIGTLSRKEICKLISYLPQYVPIGSSASVEDCIAASSFPWEKSRLDTEILEIMEKFNISQFKGRRVASLSGGEMQRVLIASTFSQNTSIILLDEPDSHLDPFQERYIFSKIAEIAKKENKTVILVSHNYLLAREFADYVTAMDNGKILWTVQAGELTDTMAKEVYGF